MEGGCFVLVVMKLLEILGLSLLALITYTQTKNNYYIYIPTKQVRINIIITQKHTLKMKY